MAHFAPPRDGIAVARLEYSVRAAGWAGRGRMDRMSTTSEWTILLFLNAKNNLEPFAFPNFEQIASIGSTPEVQIAVEFGRPRSHYANDYGGWSKTLRFHVTRGQKPVESAAVADLGHINMGD